MMKKFAMTLIGLSMLAGIHSISSIEQSGSWFYLYDGPDKKTLSASSVGEIVDYLSTFFVSRSGSRIFLWDTEGKKYKTHNANSIGNGHRRNWRHVHITKWQLDFTWTVTEIRLIQGQLNRCHVY